jgi:aspartate ammonia-lyase
MNATGRRFAVNIASATAPTAATGTDSDPMNSLPAMRTEKDMLGELDIPSMSYYGIHTFRARNNFQVSTQTLADHPALIAAIADVKRAGARANRRCGRVPMAIAEAIESACVEISEGKLDQWFVIDMIQGGAGTSTNMNANEVIANRAAEILGGHRGDYGLVHPIDHVNASQSTNDVYPAAVHLALRRRLQTLSAELSDLVASLRIKAGDLGDIVKTGRTQLQDAVAMTKGSEFTAYAVGIEKEIARLQKTSDQLLDIHLGGTAIGTGIAAPAGYADAVVEELSEITGHQFVLAADLIESTQDTSALLDVSSSLRRVAIKLSKIADDLRLLSAGPTGGFAELRLPPVQAGSSIMPGKVNPVIPELVNQVAFTVIGNDVAIACAADNAQLQLNAFEPIMTYLLLESIRHLHAACHTFNHRCIRGIAATSPATSTQEMSTPELTALAAKVGYTRAAHLASEAQRTGRNPLDIVNEDGWAPR